MNLNTSKKTLSLKEKKIRQITQFYYSKPEVQEAIFSFSKNREVVPRYFEAFGKRPDSFQYKGDIFELVRRGATSFHCSEEIWKDPLKISTSMTKEDFNELRDGWDLLIDIDSKYIDYSKIMAELIINLLKFHGVKNFGVKYSGSKGFHIIVPWNAFPEKIHDKNSSEMFPEWPRIITKYIMERVREKLIEKVTDLTRPNKYVRDFQAPKEVMPDLVLVSPRHLFRTPYSLHEKTRLASIVLNPDELKNFQPKDADPLKVSKENIRNFLLKPEPGEASELLREALDWYKDNNFEKTSDKTSNNGPYNDFKSNLNMKEISVKLSENIFPPSIKKILKGMADGRKRSLFILINLFRCLEMAKEELEKRLYDWNKKNKTPLKEGYIKSQISWALRKKPVPPPNFDKDYYKGIGISPTEEEMRYKNPVNYVVKKALQESHPKKKPKRKGKKNK